ncbi:hypothetical protein [Kingella negevensis]|nr:hypothetical protein [Kingella negevensis]MDK4679445.1 hypothetical protein [Kingella negevensis]MDK4682837.1 hypothetical protein [Kingella negevensis]MDK4691034.1 hypothetical protein [Kingella negevensis]MDK4693819.1 hypothetical protein [Kingella negevensis]MDK4700275.1 hypothetical protein [Kingella negevensis]
MRHYFLSKIEKIKVQAAQNAQNRFSGSLKSLKIHAFYSHESTT